MTGRASSLSALEVFLNSMRYINPRFTYLLQESPAVADKPARRLRKVRTVYVRAVEL